MKELRLKPTALVVCLLLMGLLASLSPAIAAQPSSTDGSLSSSTLAGGGNGKKKTPVPAVTATKPPTATKAPTTPPLPTATRTPSPTAPPAATATSVPSATSTPLPTARATNTPVPTLAPTSVPTSAGLVAAYAFNEGTGGTVADASGKGNTGTVSGASWTAQGRAGSALAFNGSSSRVIVSDSPSLDLGPDFTLEAWVFPTALSGWRNVIFKQQAADLSYALYANTDTNQPAGYIYAGGEADARGGSSLPLNAWSHLAATHDGASLRLYVNGGLVATKPVAGAAPSSAYPLEIGGNALWGESFSGQIDEVRVYNRALSQAEITTDMNSSVGGGSQPPAPTSPVTQTATPTSAASPSPTIAASPTLAAFPTTTLTAIPSPTPMPAPPNGALSIAGLSANVSSLPQYEKLELTFDIGNTVATNLQFPFDPSLPPGLAGESGISVEGLFLPPGETDWNQALCQPGFLFQDYQRQQFGGSEWIYPSGKPVWKVRFAPKSQGVWQYKVRAQDGSTYPNWIEDPVHSVTVGAPNSGNHGFVEVSPTDSRYFALSDGTTFVGQGHGTSFSNSNFTYDADKQLATYSANGVDFVRAWMTNSNIAGSAWGPWVWFGGPGYGGYLQDPGLTNAPAGSGYDFTFNLNQAAGRTTIFNGWSQGQIAVKPNTSYQLAVTAQASNVAGPRDPSRPGYGFTVKTGGWPSSVPDGLSGYPNLVPHLRDSGWTTLQGIISTSSSQHFLDNLFLTLDNTTRGEANIGEVSLKEILGGGELGPELLVKSRSDAHKDFNLLRSWDWDYALDQAAKKGVYLKLVTLEKNDRVWNRINSDGSMSGSDDTTGNFYAAPGTKVRRLQEYYWRYLSARWGYSTAVHSWELINEGDPYNGNHYDQANSFAQYMHQNEPSQHLVTTSFWHSFPVAEFWGSPQYSDIDYADLHAYISTGTGSYEWSAPSGTVLETNSSQTYQGSTGALRLAAGATSGSKTIPIRGRGEWRISAMVRADGITGSCPYGASSTLAGPQILLGLDSPNTRVIPFDAQNPNAYWLCTSPAGTYGYRKIEGTISVPDDSWHRLTLTFKNSYSTSGTAWFDSLVVQSPDGRTARIFGDGTFDDRERMDNDSALYTEIYSSLDGAKSVSGAGKPVVRGEAGIDYAGGPQEELPDLARDTKGIWLHNFLWGKLNPDGLYELYWWTDNIAKNNLYFQFKPVADFLKSIPLVSGRYRDAQPQLSSTSIEAVGQIDAAGANAHLWIRNRQHSWRNVVDGIAWGRMSGTVLVPGFAPNQSYSIEWWQFDDPGNLALRSETITADNSGRVIVNLDGLPPSITDVAVKIATRS